MVWMFFIGGDRNNGTMGSSTFLGGTVEIFAKTMVLSTFGTGGPRDLGTMEQWFDQLLGPGVPVIWEQWNNGLTNFWDRGSP